jgi:hypothetical protein
MGTDKTGIRKWSGKGESRSPIWLHDRRGLAQKKCLPLYSVQKVKVSVHFWGKWIFCKNKNAFVYLGGKRVKVWRCGGIAQVRACCSPVGISEEGRVCAASDCYDFALI